MLPSQSPIIFAKLITNVTIASNYANTSLRAIYDGSGNPAPNLTSTIVFTINAGVYMYSNGSGTAALDVGSWPTGATIILINNGNIRGAGGNGGANSGPGGVAGGTALYVRFPLKLGGGGTVYGGGGGGGGTIAGEAAGGGGAGVIGGSPGYSPSNPAQPGSEYAGGQGAGSGFGGNGGAPGVAGIAGTPVQDPFHGWPGGAAGYCIDGISIVQPGSWNGNIFIPSGWTVALAGPGVN